MNTERKTMRDALLEGIYNKMKTDDRIFFLAADFGAPKLDQLRRDFGDRFLNVGIAEQNLVNVAAGIALEGFTVFAYAIAPFLTMRAFEQIRNNLSLLSHAREVNVNLVGVGAGLSYDVSGPTHHCLEDLAVIRTLPNIEVFSPSDWLLAEKFVDHTVKVKKPKYLRFDGKPLPLLAETVPDDIFAQGFRELNKGGETCLVATGYMVHQAVQAAARLREENIEVGVIDLFRLRPFSEELLFDKLKKYRQVMTIEEAFINKGGLDCLIANLLGGQENNIRLRRLGFGDDYVFEVGGREYLHRQLKLDVDSIVRQAKEIIQKGR